jgi:hypothetical protein
MTTDRALRRTHRRSVSLAAIPFVVAAALPVVTAWGERAPSFASNPLGWLWTWLLPLLPSVAIPLIGAAILIRHPQAHRTVPFLLFGAVLLAVQVAGAQLIQPIAGLLAERSIPETVLINALAIVLTITSAFGWTYLARGLVRARRHERAGWTGALIMSAVVLAALPTAAMGGMLAGLDGPIPGGSLVTGMAITFVVVGFLEKLAIGYVAVTASRGWWAREALRRGWALAAIGAWLLLAAFLVNMAYPLIDQRAVGAENSRWIFRSISILYSAGCIALLCAFASGLPDTDDITWYDLGELDAAAATGAGRARDPFDDGDEAEGAQLFELEDRRLDA